MRKTLGLVAIAIACGSALPAVAASVRGPHQAVCRAGNTPAMLVRVTGLKAATGVLRIQSYGGAPAKFFDKGSYLDRIDVGAEGAEPIEVCVPVPREGVYAVSVRHDVNGSGKSDMRDGGGMSGNPEISLMDVMFKRRPDPARTSIRVGKGVVPVPVTMRYVDGGSFRPVRRSAAG
ncbi:MAG: DUF2141 domain-containing protein [Sphingomonas fennica]